jgi:hypothetical protein
MTKHLMDLADAYAEHCVIAGFTCDNKRRKELLAAVEAQAAEVEAAKANGAKWQSLCEANISLNEKLTKQLDAIAKHKPVASIYVATDGSREFDDWRCDLPIGRTELYAAPVAQQQEGMTYTGKGPVPWKCIDGSECKHGWWCSETYCQDKCQFRNDIAAQPVAQPAELSRLEPFVHGLGKAILRELQEAQQPAEALTNQQLYNCYIEATNQTLRPQDEHLAFAFARAIEAAHGIHAKDKP